MSQEELEAIEVAFRRRRELEHVERDRFLDWIDEAAQAEEKGELRERTLKLEAENESLREFSQQENIDPPDNSREEFERDLLLMDQAEVLADMLAEEEVETQSDDATEPTDAPEGLVEEAPDKEDEPVENGY